MRELAMVISNHTEVPIKEMIQTISLAGFRNVFIQWYNKDWVVSEQEQLDYARTLGLEVIFAHLGYQEINRIWEEGEAGDHLVECYRKELDQCFKNHIKTVILHLTTSRVAPLYNELGLLRIQRITDYAKEKGMRIAFENTRKKGYLEYVLKHIEGDHVGVCYDAGHDHAHFEDGFDFQAFQNRIFEVHLHDNDASGDQHLIPFDGSIHWERVIQNLKASGYTGAVTLECVYRKDYGNMSPLAFYKKCYEAGEKLVRMFDEERL